MTKPEISLKKDFSPLKVVLQGSPRSPDINDLNECRRLYDLGRHTEQP